MGGSSRQSEDINDYTTDNRNFQDHLYSDNLQGLAREANLNKSTIGDVSTTSNSNNTTTTITSTTDHGAIDSAVDLAELGVLSGESIAGQSIDAVIRSNDNSTAIGAMAMDFARDSGADFLNANLALSEGFAENTNKVFDKATSAVSDAMYSAVDTARAATGQVAAAWSGANRSIMDLSSKSLNEVSHAYSSATESALDAVEKTNNDSLAAVLGIVADSNNTVESNFDKSLGVVSNAMKSSSERTNDTLIKFGIGAVVVMGGFMAWSSVRG